MKSWNRLACVMLGVFVFALSFPVLAQEPEDTASEAVTLPDSVDMSLGVKDDKYVMPDGFRGSETGTGDLQWLEDVGYLMQENSDLYNVDAAAIAETASFESEPNINWEVKKECDDGSLETKSSENTNNATNSSNITTPGYYQVHNGGARLVSTPGGTADDVPEGEGSGSDSTSTGTSTSTDPAAASGGSSSTVTAQQRIGIQVHDCTSPDLWVAFQEGAGSVNMSETEEELRSTMEAKIIENKGRPFSKNADDFEAASYIFLDEGDDEDRDEIPWKKTARLSIAGNLFNERGAPKFEAGNLTAKIDQKTYNNHVNVVGGEGKNLKGVFVRRNVPFIFAAMSTDNGNLRATAGDVNARIEDADGNEVEKNGAGYMFRVPNYPRKDYEDQPEYFFVATAADKEGNITNIRMPLYVVNTKASFEGGRNE